MTTANHHPRRIRPQFRLWMLLLVVFLAAIASVPLADWWNRPTGPLAVTLLADGSLRIDDAVIAPAAVEDVLSHKKRKLLRYNIPLTLNINADPNVHSDRIVELIEISREAGFDRLTLQAASVEQLPNLGAAASPVNQGEF